MKYINLNRLFSAGAAALLLALPMTACNKNGQSEATAGTGTMTAAQSTAPDSTGTSASGSTAAETGSAAEDGTAKTGTGQTKAADQTGAVPLICGDSLTASAGEKHIAVPVRLENNPGFAVIGLSLIYDPALIGVTDKVPAAEFTLGEAAADMNAQCYVNPEKHMIGFAGYRTENVTADGTLFTCYFDVPDDAKPGQVYPFSLVAKDATTFSGEKASFQTADFTLTVQ